ncbi:MAG TPA: efflux RND transporter permease subunit [Stellaceae bacterium]|nr:efflux RND transporter permease subunit [Stellaceae bacterium]
MNISEIFIRRPIATVLLMAGILVFGVASFEMLPVAALPSVDFPTITVSAQLPGASPDTMASTVATPLEDEFTAIPGLSQMTSTSGLGSTTITLQFDLDRSIDGAASDVQTAINAAGGLLPKDLPNPPTYRKTNPSESPILIYAVYSDAFPIYALDQYANTLLAQSLSTIEGVGQVFIAGQQQPAVHVQVNPEALAARGIGIDAIKTAIADATVDSPKGNLEGTGQEFPLDTNDQLFNANQFNHLIVAYSNGAPVELQDVARIIDSSVSPRTGAWYGPAQQCELLVIERAAGANTLAVVKAVEAMLPTLEQSIPRAVHVDLISDRSQTIRASVGDVEFTLVLTLVLVVAVIFLFLHRFWATVIPAITLPLVLVGTFGAMYLLGYSIDNLSLMALTIAVGFLVDDAIVMIENVVRHIEAGEGPLEAALHGAGEIGFTIISITLSLIAVFIPLLFMSGVVGLLFHEFAMTIVLSVVISAFVSLTLTPMMCSLFLTREGEEKENRFGRALERGFERLRDAYDGGLQWVFRHQLPMLLLTIALIILTFVLYVFIPKGFFPEQDTGFIFGQAEARQDISFDGISKIENEGARIITADPAVSGVVGFAGATGGNSSESTTRYFIQLKPFGQRPSVQVVMARLEAKLAQVVGARFYLQAGQDITIGGRTEQAQYQYTLTDTDSDELNHWAPILLTKLQGLKSITDVASDQQIASTHIPVEVDRDAASRYGVSLDAVDAALYDAFGQEQVATIYSSTMQTKVVLEVEPRFEAGATDLDHIYVAASNGTEVLLSAIAKFTTKVEPLTINHQGVFPAVTLSFNLAQNASLSQAVDQITAAKNALGAPQTLNGSFQGTAQAFQASLVTMPLLIAAAILVIYILMGMLYESFIHPITILSALPAAGVGALLILMLFGFDLSLIALIGIILLIGIVKKNAIMMIDFALEAERTEGKTPQEAIHQACLLRFRPIMMTTMCALIAGLPLAVETGAGAELRRPLGIAIVGGLLVSQWLTLYTTPVIYLYLERLSQWRKGRRAQATAAAHERHLAQP